MPTSVRFLRIKLFEEQNGVCHYCLRKTVLTVVDQYDSMTVDHIVPASRGGQKSEDNIVGACRSCNNLRGDIPYDVFVAFIEEIGVERFRNEYRAGASRPTAVLERRRQKAQRRRLARAFSPHNFKPEPLGTFGDLLAFKKEIAG